MPNIDKNLKRAIKNATLELCCGDRTLKERLAAAIQTLDGFLGKREAWPPGLQARMQDISDVLKSAGLNADVVGLMDASDARRLAERILHLYADCVSPGPQ